MPRPARHKRGLDRFASSTFLHVSSSVLLLVVRDFAWGQAYTERTASDNQYLGAAPVFIAATEFCAAPSSAENSGFAELQRVTRHEAVNHDSQQRLLTLIPRPRQHQSQTGIGRKWSAIGRSSIFLPPPSAPVAKRRGLTPARPYVALSTRNSNSKGNPNTRSPFLRTTGRMTPDGFGDQILCNAPPAPGTDAIGSAIATVARR